MTGSSPQHHDSRSGALSASELEQLVSQYGPAWRMYATRMSRSPDDLVQEALLRLIRQTPPPADPAAWVFRVLRNLHIDSTRSAQKRQTQIEQVARLKDAFEAEPCESLVRREALEAALEQLEHDELLVVIGRVWGKLTLEQLGEILDCSTATAMRRQRAALDRLASLLETSSVNDSASHAGGASVMDKTSETSS